MRIAILLPMVWSVRNVLHGGVLRALIEAGVDAHLIARRWDPSVAGDSGDADDAARAADAAGIHPLLEAPGPTPRGKALLDGILASAFHRRHRISSHRIYRRWFSRNDNRLMRARGACVEMAGWVAAAPRATKALERAVDRMARQGRDLEPVRRQLRQIDPDLIWSTVSVSCWETPYRLAACDLGIPVATSILSFDNLTSRGPLARDAHYLVWGARMKEQLLRLYPDLGEGHVTITGTPQFDFHRRASCVWSRERTLETLGVPPGGRYFLYGASHAVLTPEEPQLVAKLASRLEGHPALGSHALVVRLHPLDDAPRWMSHVASQPRVRLSPAFARGSAAADGWMVPTADDHARLTSSLAHADGCINIASTLSLDAAILDRPVICIDFTREPESPRDMLYAEYGAEHYAPLVASGGIRLAHSWSELLGLMTLAVAAPARDRDERLRMVADECGPVDGHAADRVARTLITLAGSAHEARGHHDGAAIMTAPSALQRRQHDRAAP